MLKQWLDMKPTWESLIAALREETMGLNDVADKVEKEYEKLKNSATDGAKDERTGMLTSMLFILVVYPHNYPTTLAKSGLIHASMIIVHVCLRGWG